ncbi:hypothetical protein ARNL5_02149 [Anaerolineae bacterium]|nr:hypothetical protein ARNL5_02149 [Anaerolineae bacterium]
MYSLQNVAIAYAKSAKRILGEDDSFLNTNPEVMPIFVSLLLQSLEISLKHLGIESGLFTSKEARNKQLTGNGHGIEEIAGLVNSKLGANEDYPVITALTNGLPPERRTYEYVQKTIFSPNFASTRQAYQSRRLGYAEVQSFEILFDKKSGVIPWVVAVEDVANNLPIAVDIVSQWKKSKSSSPHFAIWYKDIGSNP